MISDESLKFLGKSNRRYLLATKRGELADFQADLGNTGWSPLPKNPQVQVKLFERESVLLPALRTKSAAPPKGTGDPPPPAVAAWRPRSPKKLGAFWSMRESLKNGTRSLNVSGDWKGAAYPKARGFVEISVTATKQPRLEWTWDRAKYRQALSHGWGLLVTKQPTWLWTATPNSGKTYIQLTIVERAFRVLKSELLLRPIWHHYSGRTRAHVFVCVLGYALWKTPGPSRQAGRANDRNPKARSASSPIVSYKARRMTPQMILRELRELKIGDILMSIVRRSATGPASGRCSTGPEPTARILEIALKLVLPERLETPDRIL